MNPPRMHTFFQRQFGVILSICFLLGMNVLPTKNAFSKDLNYINIIGGRLAFTDSGIGEPNLLFIHGFRLSHKVWDETTQYFTKLGARVICVDLRGHGQSEMSIENWDFDDYVEDIISLIKFLNLEGTVIIGHSFGGMIAQVVAQKYPELIKAVVLVNTTCKLSEYEKEGLIKKVKIVEKYRGFLKLLPAKLIGRVNHEFISCPSFVSRIVLGHCIEFDNRQNVNKISCKTFIIAGMRDSTVNPASSDRLHFKIENSTLLKIENARHNIMSKNKDVFNNALHSFIFNL